MSLQNQKHGAFKTACFAAMAMLCAMWALHSWASLPVVTYSHLTGECVSVSDLDGIFSCENLPEKYESRWAE